MSGSRIGRGTVIRGAVRGEGDLEIEGRVEGIVDVDGELAVTASGRVVSTDGASAPLSARRITVSGAIAGDLTAHDTIVLEEGARVLGNLRAPSIGIRPGGLVKGHVSTEGAATPAGRSQSRTAAATPRAATAPARAAAPERVAAPARAAAPARPAPPPARQAPRPPTRATARVEQAVEQPQAQPVARKGAPAPVMPALKKGAKGAMKKQKGVTR